MDLYRLAFTHSSYSQDYPNEPNNERLEFYGDAILKLIFSRYLFDKFADCNEGTLTQYRSRLVSDDLLSEISLHLAFDKKIIIGSSLQNQTRDKNAKLPKSVIGDALEAYIAAIYIDKGYHAAEEFVLSTWEPFIDKAIKDSIEQNFKSELQDTIQKSYNQSPHYKTLTVSGPDHSQSFEVGVYLNDKLLGKGMGNSKKAAGQEAAKDALNNLHKLQDSGC